MANGRGTGISNDDSRKQTAPPTFLNFLTAKLVNKINNSFEKNDKHVLIKSLWVIAYATNGLDKYEDALIRKITDLLNIKNIDMLRLKDEANPNNL